MITHIDLMCPMCEPEVGSQDAHIKEATHKNQKHQNRHTGTVAQVAGVHIPLDGTGLVRLLLDQLPECRALRFVHHFVVVVSSTRSSSSALLLVIVALGHRAAQKLFDTLAQHRLACHTAANLLLIHHRNTELLSAGGSRRSSFIFCLSRCWVFVRHQRRKVDTLCHQLCVAAHCRDAPLFKDHDAIHRRQAGHLVGDQDACLGAQLSADAALEDALPHVRIHRREHVVQQVHVGVCVHRTGQTHARLLAAAQGNALLADRGEVAGRQASEIWAQCAHVQRALVALLIQRAAVCLAVHADVLPESAVQQPHRLRREGHTARDAHLTGPVDHLTQKCLQQRALRGTALADDCNQFTFSNV
mmetsp:Transcript_2525/g.7950  ORF Transcript_2525/g.7950 Transcript_2525/m.7950 type:complete len:359 (-) Transcript_2525:1675-2751(-)